MERIILPFDKEEITEEEIKKHILWYYNKVSEGYRLLENKKKYEAREVLREINRNLGKEYKYYQKSAAQRVMWDNPLYNEYYHAVFEAFVKQNDRNSYRALSSNFYDVQDYITNYSNFRKYIKENR